MHLACGRRPTTTCGRLTVRVARPVGGPLRAMAKPTLTHEVDLHADYSANGDVEHMIQLLLYSDGTVTWQLVDPNGQLIEPPKNQTP
jgi:hypothetical protein